jgi:hypothetical protein
MERRYLSRERRPKMKKPHCFLLFLAAVIAIPMIQPGAINAQEKASVEVAMAAICTNVIDREPVGMGTSFDASTEKLYCFTKIVGALSPTDITHVWYFGDIERAEINLAVNSASWRTYSSKKIQFHEVGDWHVDVIGPEGQVLQTLEFKITP